MGILSYTFNIYRILLDRQSPYFLLEVILRTSLVFGATLLLLRWMGKRGMGELTPFEFAIIVALGSAVGDPMFYYDVPILPALLTILVIVALQRLLARITEKHKVIEHFVESEPQLLIKTGIILLENLHKEMLSRDELFEALRQNGISQLGQVDVAYLEPSGKVSVIKSSPEKPGLSTLPAGTHPADRGDHAILCCQNCGRISASHTHTDERCPTCEEAVFIPAISPHY